MISPRSSLQTQIPNFLIITTNPILMLNLVSAGFAIIKISRYVLIILAERAKPLGFVLPQSSYHPFLGWFGPAM